METDLFRDGTDGTDGIDFSLPVLSIRQPWAHAIVAGVKDVENRTWRTRFRGRVLIHAGKARDERELESYLELKREQGITEKTGGRWEKLDFGGIVGVADIVDCVEWMDSPWFTGPWGFVLRNARPLPFYRCRGALGFFRVKGGGDA